MNCPDCGQQASDSAKFCRACGCALQPVADRVCPRCGADLQPHSVFCEECGQSVAAASEQRWQLSAKPPEPSSFASGRYEVKRLLGEGGKKKVCLAHDTVLDRDVAFALIKTEGLDHVGRERVRREAQAMGRLSFHPHVVSVFDLGEHEGHPFMVTGRW